MNNIRGTGLGGNAGPSYVDNVAGNPLSVDVQIQRKPPASAADGLVDTLNLCAWELLRPLAVVRITAVPGVGGTPYPSLGAFPCSPTAMTSGD